VVFFARYEASQFGAKYIRPEHLLLGLFREDKKLAHQFLSSHTTSEELREQIRVRLEIGERRSTSVDLPLDAYSKRVLAFAAAGFCHIGQRNDGDDASFCEEYVLTAVEWKGRSL
jgi:ATP-dependent Clp protease ATP-binding subunit ClpC